MAASELNKCSNKDLPDFKKYSSKDFPEYANLRLQETLISTASRIYQDMQLRQPKDLHNFTAERNLNKYSSKEILRYAYPRLQQFLISSQA